MKRQSTRGLNEDRDRDIMHCLETSRRNPVLFFYLHRNILILLGESNGQRSLDGYNPWGRKESDTTAVP